MVRPNTAGPRPVPPYRDLVTPGHRPFYDHIVGHLTLRGAGQQPVVIQPDAWAALCTALAQSIAAHRAIAPPNHDTAGRLALAERLLADLTNADSVDEVMPRVDDEFP